MAKTQETIDLENEIWNATQKQGVYGCLEVTIGPAGSGRVDYLTVDTKGIWRCYEIKATVADFHSKAEKTFVANYNYFVIPQALYENESVRNEIPPEIGIYIGGCCKRPAKRLELAVDEAILKDSMIRSMAREVQASRKSQDIRRMKNLERECNVYERQFREERSRRFALQNAIVDQYGAEVLHELQKKSLDYA